ncbi:Exo 5'-3' exonuclease (including N-terminal domain of PolI) [uncultured Caudovirales phage]|uniref:Exo 5'-3' exonuclease (Including N-terminal domain of PolI) n=1 Tax=uncultured Caudovirales phage TaxID=2100421 RepID=A0A6J7WRM9_9CAUD|nr:Exo 5'-3' exonuclease (including N-terminal domain of PolI) [uncultured Caudovirales phage]
MSKTFEKLTEQQNTLLIVDSLNLAFRYKHTGATDFAEDYLRTVKSLQKSYKASHVIIAGDQGSSSYRKAIYPEYKQNRKDKFAEQTDAEKAAFELFFEDFTKTLEHIQENTEFPVIKFQGVEADDIAAYIVSKKSKLPIDDIWLVSSDKDWDLLVQPGVSRFSYVTRKETTIENWRTHYDFEQEDYISIKCLTGDSGDNVFGVPGIGPKRAIGLVNEYGSTYDIIASIPLSGRYKYIEALNQCKDQLALNYKLMDLVTFCDEAIGVQNCEQIDNLLELYLK